MKLEKAIKNQIKKINPKCGVDKFPEDFIKIIEELETFISKNQKTYLNRKRYDIHWAFQLSQKKINLYFNKYAVQKIHLKAKKLKSRNCSICDKFIDRANAHRRNHLKRRIQIYSVTSLLITSLDVFFAVVLVFALSHVKMVGDHLFSTGLLFALLIAILKVVLDKFFITPKVHQWGWKMYNKINQTFQKNIATSLALLFILGKLSNDIKPEETQLLIDKTDQLLEI